MSFAQTDTTKTETNIHLSKKQAEEKAEAEGKNFEFERPFNFFAAAGISVRVEDVYSVAVSPVNQTVHFEKLSPIFSSLTTGLIWNPLGGTYKVYDYKGKERDWHYEYRRKWYATALLINVFNLNLSGNQINNELPIDVGFGIGYRKNGFCFLFTAEFTPIRQPRQYFIDQYKDKNTTLILQGSQSPVANISTDDNNLFIAKLIPSLGIKLAYAFTKR